MSISHRATPKRGVQKNSKCLKIEFWEAGNVLVIIADLTFFFVGIFRSLTTELRSKHIFVLYFLSYLALEVNTSER